MAGLSRTLLRQMATGGIDLQEKCLDQTGEVLNQRIRRMPILLRVAMTTAVFVFNGYGLVVSGHLFCDQSEAVQQEQIRQWRHSPVGVCREFVNFFDKMSVFIYLSLCPKI